MLFKMFNLIFDFNLFLKFIILDNKYVNMIFFNIVFYKNLFIKGSKEYYIFIYY